MLKINGADELFFKELFEKVSALKTFSQTTTLSPKVALARMKKYLTGDTPITE